MKSQDSIFSGASRAGDFFEDETGARPGSVSEEVPVDGESYPHGAVDSVDDTHDEAASPEVGLSAGEGPAPAPAPAPARVVAVSEAPLKVVARVGWRGAVNRMGGALVATPREIAVLEAQAQQVAHRDRVRAARTFVRQATFPRAVSVMVSSPVGGVGATTLALMLGSVLGSIRTHPVVVVESTSTPGMLRDRAEGAGRLGVGDLALSWASVGSAGHAAAYTMPQSSGVSVMATTQPRAPFSHDDVLHITHVLDQFYVVRVMDAGSEESTPAWRATAISADVWVLPVEAREDAVRQVARHLYALSGTRVSELASRALIVLMDTGRRAPLSDDTVRTLIGSHHHVARLPYDEHLAAGGEVTLNFVGAPFMDALTLVAADTSHALSRAVPHSRKEDFHGVSTKGSL